MPIIILTLIMTMAATILKLYNMLYVTVHEVPYHVPSHLILKTILYCYCPFTNEALEMDVTQVTSTISWDSNLGLLLLLYYICDHIWDSS